jgi:precorrin-6B methylase 2
MIVCNLLAHGYPDYFDDRHNRKMLRLAGIKSSDIFYDLGCGNASILILAVKEFDVKNAIGVEDDLYRNSIARKSKARHTLKVFCTQTQALF